MSVPNALAIRFKNSIITLPAISSTEDMIFFIDTQAHEKSPVSNFTTNRIDSPIIVIAFFIICQIIFIILVTTSFIAVKAITKAFLIVSSTRVISLPYSVQYCCINEIVDCTDSFI